MASGYPTPTIYYYRVKQITVPGNPTITGNQGSFFVEFSSNGGATYQPAFSSSFGSLHSAYEAIGVLVGAELAFQSEVYQGQIPQVNYLAYPPATPI